VGEFELKLVIYDGDAVRVHSEPVPCRLELWHLHAPWATKKLLLLGEDRGLSEDADI
jgi:hypothetical protein